MAVSRKRILSPHSSSNYATDIIVEMRLFVCDPLPFSRAEGHQTYDACRRHPVLLTMSGDWFG